MALIIDPIRVFEIAGQVYPVIPVLLGATVANNQQILAGTSGKIIRIMGWAAQSKTATVGTYAFKSASGGTYITPFFSAPPATNGALHQFPLYESGYGGTNTGEGLFVDVATGDVQLLVFYINYTA